MMTRADRDALQGYMRLGKIYRLEKKPEMAWAAWSAGIEVGQNEGLIRTAKYEVCEADKLVFVFMLTSPP